MPASVVLSAIYGSTFMAAAALGATGLAVATFAINFAASYIITRIFGQKAPDQTDSGVRQQVPPSSTNSIPVVYGDAWMGGTFVDAVLSTDQKTMYYVLAISNISPNGQFTYDRTKFYYGDRLVAFDGADPTKVISLTDGDGNVDDKISGNLYINLYTSTTAGVITNVTGAAPSTVMGGSDIAAALRWTGTRQMNGLAFAIVKLIYNRDAGTTALQPVTFKVKHALNSTGFAKPGDALYDYLTSPTYGGAVPAASVSTTACTALNSYSDATITYTPSGGGSATQARYRINGVLDTGRSVLENVDKILTSCDSWLSYQASTGQWAPVINKAETTSFAFNDSNIIGDIKISVVDLASSINQIEVSFPFKDNKDQPEYVFLQTPAGLLYPNEPVNKYSTSFDLVNDSVQASYLANRILEQAREDLIVSFSTAYTGIQVDAGDVISVTNADYGWSAKPFRVTKVQEASLPDGNLGARIEASEYNSQVYDDFDITQFTAAPNSEIASVYFFPPLSAPTFSDALPSSNPPTFSVSCQLPSSGRVTSISLFYTTSATPSQTDWKIWATQVSPNSQPFTQSASIKFTDVILGSEDYYFAFSVSNEYGSSKLSAISSVFSWATISGSSFVASFQPPAISVSRTGGTPTFTGITPQLYASNVSGPIDFVTSQTDGDVAFVPNSWRIGASSTTGNADVSTTGGLVLGAITDGGTYAQWDTPTAMSSTPAELSVPIRYKDPAGLVIQYAATKLQFVFVDNGANGTRTAELTVYQWASSAPTVFPSGTSTYTWATGAFTAPSTPNSWVQNPGAGSPGQTLYSCTQKYADTGTTATSVITWTTSTSSVVGYAGTDGFNGTRTAVLDLYQWSSSVPTTFPSGTSTYTWATAQFTNPATLNGWTQTPVTGAQGQTLYIVSQTYADTATTATSSVTWSASTARSIGVYGSDGLNGTRTAFLEVYQWAASTPTVFPSGTSTYTWATGAFTAPTTPNSWNLTPGASTPNYKLYACSVRYSDNLTTSTSSVTWGTSTAYVVGAAGDDGLNGTRTAQLELYQWASSAPSTFPSGTSTYTWSTGTFTNPTLNGWTQTPGVGAAGQNLYACKQLYSDTATSSTSTVTWSTSTSYIVGYAGTDGANATQSAQPTVYQWAVSIPASPSGAATYTWSTSSFGAAPSGWTLTPGTSPSVGYTLWGATVTLTASAVNSTTNFNWTSASITARGYSGTNGNDGSSSRICYTSTDLTALNSTPTTITTAGSVSFPAAGSWGATIGGVNQNWVATPPTIIAGQSVYQSDGVYNPITGNTVWNVPYLSTLKVGSLSAITVNTGALTVQDSLTINTLGNIKGGQTAYNTGTGFFLGYSSTAYKFSIGSTSQSLTWDGAALTITGNIFGNGSAEFTGSTSTAFSLTTAVKANSGNSADIGLAAYGKLSTLTYPVYAFTNSTYSGGLPPAALYGNTNRSTAVGVLATNTGGGTALKIEGLMAIDNTTLVTNLNADKLDGKDASAFVEIASGQANSQYLYYVNNNTAPTDPVNRAAWIKVSTNGGAVVWFPGYV